MRSSPPTAGWHDDVQARSAKHPGPLSGRVDGASADGSWISAASPFGDACHLMPFLAQGANMAIEDGYILARALTESDAMRPSDC